MRKFDTRVQLAKYNVLKEVARFAWNGTLLEKLDDIPNLIVPGRDASIGCCSHKERAVAKERVKLAIGGNKANPNIIEVIETACDECPAAGYEITTSCRGCLAHRCEQVCPRGAISYDNRHVGHIDKEKCINCGKCAAVCPYSAIVNRKRPCQNACKIKAISIKENNAASINNDKCIQCGACVYQCPFGAIMDKSFILDVIDLIQKSENNTKFKVYAVVAPSVASQFSYAKLGQVISGLKKLGFHSVIEAALGADIVALSESKELVEKGFITSSCCPAFVKYIKSEFPELTDKISHNLSPMAAIGKYIKEHEENSKVVFVGPCTSKKGEALLDEIRPLVDSAITFEELQALFDSKDIDLNELDEDNLNDASYFGRIFARSGGLSEAVAQALKENGNGDFPLEACVCDGIEECRAALMKAKRNLLKANFIEGMACSGGCIGGAGCLTHGDKNKSQVDNYGKETDKNTISDAVKSL